MIRNDSTILYERYLSLEEEANRRVSEDKQKTEEKYREKEDFYNALNKYRYQRELKDSELRQFSEETYNKYLGMALNAIYITALEHVSPISRNSVLLAEKNVENYIKEHGGARNIISSNKGRTSLLDTIFEAVDTASKKDIAIFKEAKEVEEKEKEEDTKKEKKDDEDNPADGDENTSGEDIKVGDSDKDGVDDAKEVDDRFSVAEDDDKEDNKESEDDKDSDKDEDSKDDKEEDKEDDKESKEDDKDSDEDNKEDEDDNDKESKEEDNDEDSEFDIDTSDDDDNDDKEEGHLTDQLDEEPEKEEKKIDSGFSVSEDDEDEDDNSEEVKDNKEEMFDKLENDGEVNDAVEVIAKRISDAETKFIEKNAEDKKKIENIVNKVDNRIKAVTKSDKKEEDKDKEVEEQQQEATRMINDIKESRFHSIFEELVKNNFSYIMKDEFLRESYADKLDGNRINVARVVETTRVMYGFLEFVNSIQLEKVDREYLSNVINH